VKHRRCREQLLAELRVCCKHPQNVYMIMREVRINNKQFKEFVDLGIIRKVYEKKRGWAGPPAHFYQTVKEDV